MLRHITAVLASCAALLSAGPAAAGSMTFNGTIGQSYTSLYNAAYVISPSETINLSAEVTYSLASISSSTGVAVFNVGVKNTTANQTNTNRLTGFAIDVIAPPLTNATGNSSVFTDIALNSNLNNSVGKVDFCTASQNACNGGGGGGLGENSALHSFQLTLSFAANSIPPISFTNFYVRYQSIGSTDASTAFQGCVKNVDPNCGGTTIIRVPEPSSVALAGLAMLGLAAVRRRRQR